MSVVYANSTYRQLTDEEEMAHRQQYASLLNTLYANACGRTRGIGHSESHHRPDQPRQKDTGEDHEMDVDRKDDKPPHYEKLLIIERCQYDYNEEWESDSEGDSELESPFIRRHDTKQKTDPYRRLRHQTSSCSQETTVTHSSPAEGDFSERTAELPGTPHHFSRSETTPQQTSLTPMSSFDFNGWLSMNASNLSTNTSSIANSNQNNWTVPHSIMTQPIPSQGMPTPSLFDVPGRVGPIEPMIAPVQNDSPSNYLSYTDPNTYLYNLYNQLCAHSLHTAVASNSNPHNIVFQSTETPSQIPAQMLSTPSGKTSGGPLFMNTTPGTDTLPCSFHHFPQTPYNIPPHFSSRPQCFNC